MGAKQSTHSVLIAIDFGTTYSGYAYSFRRKKEIIHCNPNWGAELGSHFWKTPTSLMYTPDSRTDNGFGFKAEAEYFRLIEEDKGGSRDDRPMIFKCFKMQLYEKENSSQFRQMAHKMMLKSDDERERLALEVFADALKYMKNHALNQIKKSEGIEPEDVLWIVTVPAIWKDRQKIFMREACHKASLIDRLDSRNLLIALEPECASLYCRSLSWEKFVGLEREKKPNLKSGTVYMTVDLGGGTLDITVHKVVGDGKVEEVIPPLGGPFGGNCVNEAFTDLLRKVLGDEFISYVKTQRPSIWLRVMQQFEDIKRSFDEGTDLRMQIYWGFAKCYEEKYGGQTMMEKIESVPREQHGVWVTTNADLVISSDTMRTLFDYVVDGITENLFKALKNAKAKRDSCEVRYIFLVGGFSDCKYVQKAVRDIEAACEPPKPVILIPEEASLCVLKGAVVFGHNPECIKSRVSGLTYAILSYRPYKENRDDGSRMVRVNGKLVVKYLDAIIKKGDAVPEGTMKKRTVKIPKSSTLVERDIYISESRGVDDPSSSQVRRLGKLVVELAETKRKDKDVELQFIFGNTELEVRTDHSGAVVSVSEEEDDKRKEETDGNTTGIPFDRRNTTKCIVM